MGATRSSKRSNLVSNLRTLLVAMGMRATLHLCTIFRPPIPLPIHPLLHHHLFHLLIHPPYLQETSISPSTTKKVPYVNLCLSDEDVGSSIAIVDGEEIPEEIVWEQQRMLDFYCSSKGINFMSICLIFNVLFINKLL